jgi:hypothetical protein
MHSAGNLVQIARLTVLGDLLVLRAVNDQQTGLQHVL